MMKVQPVRIGEAYQADIPALLPLEVRKNAVSQRMPPNQSQQQWTPTRFASNEVTEFLRSFCRLHESELGLQCLFAADYDVEKAVQLLHANRRRNLRQENAELQNLSEEAFEEAIRTHGKKFFIVQQQFENATTKDMVNRFYRWKRTTAYARWRERMRAKRNKESARLRTWGDSDESDTSDFHNEHCELCFTGGQLLCCDGCERAYHFSCVTPPIKEVPQDDWFCSHCTAILKGSSLTLRPSEENEHCGEVLIMGDEDEESSNDNGEEEEKEEIDDDEISGDEQNAESINTSTDDTMRDLTIKSEVSSISDDSSTSERITPSRGSSPNNRVLTDNDESDSGSKTLRQPMGRSRHKNSVGASLPYKRASDALGNRIAVKTPLALEKSPSSTRKRQRKIETPRRIPQRDNS